MKKKRLLSEISADRIQDEVTKLIMGKGAYKVLFDYPEIIFSIIPELKPLKTISQYQKKPHFSMWDHVTRVIKNSPNDMHIRWSALLHDIGKQDSGIEVDSVREKDKDYAKKSEEIAREVLTRLNFKKTSKKKILLMIKNLDRLTKMDTKAIKEYMGDYGESEFFDLFSLAVSDNEGQLEDMKSPEEIYKEIKNTARKIIDDKHYYKIKDLAIKGSDLSEMGYIGKDIGEVLRKLHEVVLNGTVKNDRESLAKYLSQTKAGS